MTNETISALRAMIARKSASILQMRLMQAAAEFEAALLRYAAILDEVHGYGHGDTLRLILRLLKEDAGLPIRNITSDFDTSALQEAVAQLEATINQSFEIHEDEIVLLEKMAKSINQKFHPKPKLPYNAIRTQGKPAVGYTHKPTWNRTRSNPKLR